MWICLQLRGRDLQWIRKEVVRESVADHVEAALT